MSKIITISREFGSGGRELGKRLAEELGIAYYDREIITAISEKSGLAEKYVADILEKSVRTYYPITFGRTFSYLPSLNDNQTKVMVVQQQIIKELAAKGDCVIVGRCADIILSGYQPLKLFVYADMESKIKRCRSRETEEEHFSDSHIVKQIKQIDRNRARQEELLSNCRWGAKEAYHLCINTSGMKIKSLLPTLTCYSQCYFERNKE